MEIKLKPCPFCGGEAKNYNACGLKMVACVNCLCKTSFFDTEEEAAEAWNKRAEINASNALDALEKEDER